MSTTAEWRKKKIQEAIKLRKQGMYVGKIAQVLEVGESTLYRWFANPDWFGTSHPGQISSVPSFNDKKKAKSISADVSARQLSEIRFYRDLVNKFRKEDERTEIILGNLKKSISVITPSKPFLLPKQGDADEETLVLLLSDEQIGTEGRKAETGFYDFNLDIFEKELQYYYEKALKIVALHRSSTPIKKLWIFCLGDNVENETVFAGQPFQIEVDVMEQFFRGIELIGRFIADLSRHFEEVHTIWISGNHGRMGKPGEHKYYVNWDYLFAKFIEQKLSKHKNISFNIPKKWWVIEKIANWKFLLVHGEDIRRYMKFPWYDTARFDADYSKILQSIGEDFTYLCFAHHHVPLQWDSPYGERMCNGTFVGYNIFALKRLRASVRPSQVLFFLHPRVGISGRYIIRLDMAGKRKK